MTNYKTKSYSFSLKAKAHELEGIQLHGNNYLQDYNMNED